VRRASDFLQVMETNFGAAGSRGLMFQTATDAQLDGRTLTLDGRSLIHFGSCSYLGLELDERLKQGAIDAVIRYGTQFSASRVFVSTPLYEELEGLLTAIFGQPVVLAPTTTLAHASALPALVGEDDAIILDQQVHASVRAATHHVRVTGVPVEVVRHNALDQLEERVRCLRRSHRRVWYMADGVYSIFGDRAPMGDLQRLLERYEALHLYLDDAHAMSWLGKHGRGWAMEALPAHPRVVVATSLAKGFGVVGGVLLVPDEATRRRIRATGGGLVFSGPIQPASLGAAIASARLHLSDELPHLQARLLDQIRTMNELLLARGLPLVAHDEAPVRFIGTGSPRAAYSLAARLVADGYFPNVAVYPAVPMTRAGLRFTVTNHLTADDLTGFADAIARHLPAALDEAGVARAAIDEEFGLHAGALGPVPPSPGPLSGAVPAAAPRFHIEQATTIAEVDAATWDGMFQGRGLYDTRGLRFLEAAFGRPGRPPEHTWQFRYYIVREPSGAPVLATFFTETLSKDDMIAPPEVSRAIEARRQAEPYFMTSRVMQMGAPLTEGDHLWYDPARDWQEALAALLKEVEAVRARAGATSLMLRDLDAADPALDASLRGRGFVPFPMPESWELRLDATSYEAHVKTLSTNNRRHHRQKVQPNLEFYELTVLRGDAANAVQDDLAAFQALYRNVQARGLTLNTFALPDDIFAHTLAHPGWEVLVMRPRGSGDPRPVGVATAFKSGDLYVPFVIGLDYHYVYDHGLYRVFMHAALQRAWAHGARRLQLGFGAGLEKQRFGARPRERAVYVRAADDYHLEVLGQWMSARVASPQG
jgi:7-keto-8-aminopelargonate synthetase-like enzyme